jgi:hypothetical protein
LVPAAAAALMAEEMMKSSQSMAALVPYASSSSIATRLPPLPLPSLMAMPILPTEPAPAVAEGASPGTRQQSREMAAVAVVGCTSPSRPSSPSFSASCGTLPTLSSSSMIDDVKEEPAGPEGEWTLPEADCSRPLSARDHAKEKAEMKALKKRRQRPQSVDAPLHSQLIFAVEATNKKLSSSGPKVKTSTSKSSSKKEKDRYATSSRGDKAGLRSGGSALVLGSAGGPKAHSSNTTTPATSDCSNGDTPYHRIPAFMRNSLTRRKALATATPITVTFPIPPPESQTDTADLGGALGRRRMGIADIDAYQLLRLSESVPGGFSSEEEEPSLVLSRCRSASVDNGNNCSPVVSNTSNNSNSNSTTISSISSPSTAKRKDSKTRTWGKSHKV